MSELISTKNAAAEYGYSTKRFRQKLLDANVPIKQFPYRGTVVKLFVLRRDIEAAGISKKAK